MVIETDVPRACQEMEKVTRCCWKLSLSDANALSVTLISAVYFFSFAVSAMATKYVVNKRIAGDAYDPNSDSAFTDITMTLLRSVAAFIMGRYTCGLGDYLGRKPLLSVSIASFVISRFIFLFARKPTDFYAGSIISGSLDCFFSGTLAWLSDLFPNEVDRSKYIGRHAGFMAGVAFLFGIPIGLVMIRLGGLSFPLVASIFGGICCFTMLMLTSIDDTKGVRTDPNLSRHIYGNRYFPRNWKGYIVEHFPISVGSWTIIQTARHPCDWLALFLLYTAQAVVAAIFLQYMLVVYDFTPLISGVCLLFAGAAIAFVAPVMMRRYHPIPIILYCGGIFALGCLLLAVSGSGVSLDVARILGVLGTTCLGVGVPFVPSYQVILTNQYDRSSQGINVARHHPHLCLHVVTVHYRNSERFDQPD